MKQVNEQELKQLQDLGSLLNDIIMKIGEYNLSKKILLDDIDKINDLISKEEERFKEFREKETVLFQKFTEQYGTSNIDVVTGEIKP